MQKFSAMFAGDRAKMYMLRYLSLVETDLYDAASYIANVLNNPQAAERLLTETERQYWRDLRMPLHFEPYHSAKQGKDVYYWMYIGNYTIFYVVIDDVLEVRRFIYIGRDFDRLL